MNMIVMFNLLNSMFLCASLYDIQVRLGFVPQKEAKIIKSHRTKIIRFLYFILWIFYHNLVHFYNIFKVLIK